MTFLDLCQYVGVWKQDAIKPGNVTPSCTTNLKSTFPFNRKLEFYYINDCDHGNEIARVFDLSLETSTLTSEDDESLEGIFMEDGSITWSDKNVLVNAVWIKEGQRISF